MNGRREKQRGNALFLILIAVALFAALAYAVSSSGRGSGSVGKEQAIIAAAQMTSYMGQVQQAVTRLILVNKCTATNISFYSDQYLYPNHYDNGTSPADKSCHVFDSAGAGVAWQKPPTQAQAAGGFQYAVTGILEVRGVGVDDPGSTSGEEIVMTTHVSKDMCIQINNSLGIPNPSGDPPWNQAADVDIQTGLSVNGAPNTFVDGEWIGGPEAFRTPSLNGKQMGCYYSVNALNYYFYQVLLPR